MMPNIFFKTEPIENIPIKTDIDLSTDNEDDDDDDIEQYNNATIDILNEKLIKRSESLNFLKTLFDNKIRKLTQSKCILELKYAKYKRCYNFWNISTIILTSSLTLI